MAVSEEKTRTLLTIAKSDKEILEKLAKEDERSLNNLIIKILKDYIKENYKK